MRVVVFGAGGIGGYFGAKLASAGVQTSFIARGRHLEALRESGLRVRSPEGDLFIEQVEATDDPAELLAGNEAVDVVLITVKSWQLDSILSGLESLMGAKTFVVPLLNGVDAAPQLSEALGDDRVVPGTCTIISYVNAPGEIVHVGATPRITFGEIDGRRSERVQSLRDILEQAEIRAKISDSIDAALWSKLLFVASVGGVGAVTRAPFGVIRQVAETRAMLGDAMREIHELASARGVGLPAGEVEKAMSFVDRLPANGTTSLQRDIVAGRRSELDAWNGAIARLGRESGVRTPVHDFLYHSLLPLELQARGSVRFPA